MVDGGMLGRWADHQGHETNICGSDLHLYETMGAFMSTGDVLGHEAIGIVLEVGRDISRIRPGDRVVVPFQISCGHGWMCERRSTRNARPPRYEEKAEVPHCSATRSCTARCRAAKPSTSGPEAQSTHSWYRTDHRTTASSTCPTYFRQRGRGWSTPASPTVAHCSSWASGRSATWPADRPAEVDRQDHRGGPGR